MDQWQDLSYVCLISSQSVPPYRSTEERNRVSMGRGGVFIIKFFSPSFPEEEDGGWGGSVKCILLTILTQPENRAHSVSF